MSVANHGGTFNGCLETIHRSLEDFVKEKVQQLIPAVRLDHRTPLGKCLAFLQGNAKRFIVVCALNFSHVDMILPGPDGTEHEERKDPPTGGIFTREGSNFMDDLIDERNTHTHVTSSYPMIAAFRLIKIAIGTTHVLVFNPTSTTPTLIIEQDVVRLRDEINLMHLRALLNNDTIDMESCLQYDADLILECLTKKDFIGDATEENLNIPPFGTATHALVIYYGLKKFFVYIRRTEYNLLHSYFGYESGDRWRTHYFKFRAQSLLSRLLSNH